MRSKRGERQERIIFMGVPHGRAGHHSEMKNGPVMAIFRPAIVAARHAISSSADELSSVDNAGTHL
jgi:hypothetical protein